MKELARKALAVVPLTEATVESFYDGTRSGTPEQCLKALCISHERLRYELQGQTVLVDDQEVAANKLADCWMLLDSIARGPWTDCPQANLNATIQAAQNILRQQQAPGWKTDASLTTGARE